MKEIDRDRFPNTDALAQLFFPERQISGEQESAPNQQHGEQITVDPNEILPYLQTIFFEEHFVEVQIDHITRIFFACLIDDDPAAEESAEQASPTPSEQNHEPGSYLKEKDSVLLTPLTPGIGNAHVRSSKQVILRYFSGTVEVELGCRFRQQDAVREIPVLRFAFPEICRVTKINRPYRVKTVSTVEAHVSVLSPVRTKAANELFSIVDISVMGVAFQSVAAETLFEVGENIVFVVKVKNIKDLSISGIVRRVTGLRNKTGHILVYGVQFDLESRALAAEIEQTVSAIQRLHLRELANRMSDFRGVRIMR